jgi:hypothetical protein
VKPPTAKGPPTCRCGTVDAGNTVAVVLLGGAELADDDVVGALLVEDDCSEPCEGTVLTQPAARSPATPTHVTRTKQAVIRITSGRDPARVTPRRRASW